MARGGGNKKVNNNAATTTDPELEERLRLKNLAFSKDILSKNPAKVSSSTALAPSKTVAKHHGRDILRKSQRKNRYLFSFPGLLGPIAGGKIGDLKDLGTKNPVLYLDFPQGQMKLFGTIVYPKNRYLTLQFSKGGKNVTCDDYFDNMIVFSDAWWIGAKDENPEELRLPLPKELNMGKHEEYDFKGGIGATSARKQASGKSVMKCLEPGSPEVDLEDDLTTETNDHNELAETTPTRQSARTAGKTFNFAEGSSGDDFVVDGAQTSEEEDDKVDLEVGRNYTSKKTGSSSPVVFEVDNEDVATLDPDSVKSRQTAKAKDPSNTGRTSLVQTTLSSLFQKAEQTVSKSRKVSKKIEKKETGSTTIQQKKKDKFEDDDIEEFSTTSQDIDVSDEDWAA